jgi:chromosome segregation ATPase
MRFVNDEILGKSDGKWDVVLVHGSSLLVRRTAVKDEMPTNDLQRLASELLSKNTRVEQLTEELSASRNEHNAVVSKMRTDTGALSRSLDDCQKEAEHLRAQLKEATTKSELEIRTLREDFREALGRFEAEVNALRTEKRLLEYERKTTKEQKRENIVGREDELQRALNEAQSKYAELSKYLDVMQSSLSWKLTAPIRKVKELIFPGWKG